MPLVVPANVFPVYKYSCMTLFVGFSLFVFQKVKEIAPEPYIDEIFHLRQCQAYCDYKFTQWDDKITTPPGLYTIGFVYSKLIELVTGYPACLDSNVLRSVNLMGGLVVLPLVLHVFKRYNPNQFWSINIISQPLMFTYYFLFYTDVWSTILIVFALALVNNKRAQHPFWSALVSFCSLWFRQTNILWICFIAVVYIDKQVINTTGVLDRIVKFINTAFQNWLNLTGYVLNAVLFVVFLKVNGGITLGDSGNHEIKIHLVQLFYSTSFIAFFGLFSGTLSSIKGYATFITHNLVVSAGLFSVVFLAVEYTTIVHPFLLADNRHFAFYIYRRIIKRLPPVLMAIPHHFSSFTIGYLWKGSFMTCLAFVVALVGTLVPSPLFEPRYYLTPVVIFNLFIEHNNNVLEFLWLNSINVICFYVFSKKQIIW
ncbi:Dol-P-Glc:Glc(2)Man(9)GlcNAc(2)-PP-Dol alpha-1,2-glucosyltransferase [Candida viswanathii]|uniref:Dol-P-Glc:Glc(2)Man(9)GlcNAc(2)-PP-Dol alpha-1,2-glucosyltransferase n=1 Tax=Candida viswanathii TaxID=5486 RepID=A0A367XW42_9ASCO|nr:Dol-P-Glc:Glc(2)Man(9)GlcNAc(2)-PP-Dol alpha-1,2-glucosyltransferase [Candida viswanathii]